MKSNNLAFDHTKYRPFAFAPKLTDRTWCDQLITQAPIWTSVDLRDGNQALIEPMNIEQKLRFFKMLVAIGFKEIEIGFPSASKVEFDFTRKLIEEKYVPDDVTLQVLVQAREHLIERTFEALKGAKRAIVHVYNSTSKVQRDKVYQKSKEEICAIAVEGARLLQQKSVVYPDTEWVFEYSPESFSQTETDFAIEVCYAVCQVWKPWEGQAVILNLPATVEASTPNIFADQVEYFCRHLPCRRDVTVSLHTHNDRGCAIAAAELGLLAGADRIEGTLFGNGERTGNMDIVTMAMNLYTQGIDPKLDFGQIGDIGQIVSECNQLHIHPRHPYIGELVFTAFSGSHQDAIKKSLDYNEAHQESSDYWDVAYLPIDPKDVGRDYQDVVRINSQSGKGGTAYVLQRHFGFDLPRWVQIDFAKVVQNQAEQSASELKNDEILALFEKTYVIQSCYSLNNYAINNTEGEVVFVGDIYTTDKCITVTGQGNGALSAFIVALVTHTGKSIHITNYTEHAIESPSLSDTTLDNRTDSQAVAYIQLSIDGQIYVGVGICSSTVSAMLKATLSALSQAPIDL